MRENNFITIILALILFLFETFMLFHLSSMHQFFVWHSLAIAILALYLYWNHSQGKDLLYPIILLMSTLGASSFGIGTFLLIVIFKPLCSLYATQATVWFEGLYPEKRIALFDRILRRIKSGWDDYSRSTDASSFKLFFKYGSVTEKQMVLDAIAENYDPIYKEILKEALEDDQNTVRIQAGAIITKIDTDFNNELKRLMALHNKKPDDLDFVLQLAKHADAYAFNILDGMRQKEMALFATKMYRIYYESDPQNDHIWLAIGRLLYHQHDYQGFITWYEEAKKKRKGILPAMLHSWYLDSLYNLKEYVKLLANAKEH